VRAAYASSALTRQWVRSGPPPALLRRQRVQPPPRASSCLPRSAPGASVCTGAFLLAESGLLDGRRATSHWAFCKRLANDYPSIRVEPDQIFIRDGVISTSGGVTSGIDLALAMVEEDWGRKLALMVAQYLGVFVKRPGGKSQFSAYIPTETSRRPDLCDLQAWIMAHVRYEPEFVLA
jgi:transcriptional regulator GlxA family with amidase domain